MNSIAVWLCIALVVLLGVASAWEQAFDAQPVSVSDDDDCRPSTHRSLFAVLAHTFLFLSLYVVLQQKHHRELIINGQKAVKGRYPYFVTINHYCGGALIAPDIVVAAGHCKGPNLPRVRVGTYSFTHDVEGQDYEPYEVIEMVRHPSWKRFGDDEFVHDFLLLKLERPSSHPFIKLNRHANTPRDMQEVTAMGVGKQAYDRKRDLTYKGRIHDSHICTTGGPNNERDAWYVVNDLI